MDSDFLIPSDEDRIGDLVRRADRLNSRGSGAEAIALLGEAWSLLSEPKTAQHAAISIAGALGDLLCESERYQEGAAWMETALRCPGGSENAMVHLRLGQALFQLGRHDEGVDELVKAHELGGRKVFRSVPPAYGILLNQRLRGTDLSDLLPEEFRYTPRAGAAPPNPTPAPAAPTEGRELPDAIHAEIERLSERGNAEMDEERFSEAYGLFAQAWQLLPEPKLEWEAAVWLQASLGDATFFLERYADALYHMDQALLGEALDNPFIHLRRGQALFELGDRTRALDALMRAWMLDPEIFEDEDPKYLRALRAVARLDQ
ncbi:MAG: tetratricopeptide repeat protein [Armatimonadota bacterium]